VTQAAGAPERVILFSRDGKNDLDLTQHRVYLGTGGAAIKILDIETGRARSTTRNDLYQLARSLECAAKFLKALKWIPNIWPWR